MAGVELQHCVHGEWMTVSQACERLGVNKKTMHNWRQSHRRPNGKPALLEDAWDFYAGRAAGTIPDSRGRRPTLYRYRGKRMSIPQIARLTGIPVAHIYAVIRYHHCSPEDAVKRVRAREIERAVDRIMDIINGE